MVNFASVAIICIYYYANFGIPFGFCELKKVQNQDFTRKARSIALRACDAFIDSSLLFVVIELWCFGEQTINKFEEAADA